MEEMNETVKSNFLVHFEKIWTAAILALALIVALLTYRDYGVSWDEPVHAKYGQLICRFFASGFRDDACNRYLLMANYGPLADFAATILADSTIDPAFSRRHLLAIFCSLLSILAVARFAWLLRSRLAVIVATLALALNPIFYGHSFFNPTDIPFACVFAWFAYFLCRWIMSDSFSMRRALITALSLGVLLSVRPGGLPIVMLLVLAALMFRVWLISRTEGQTPRLHWKNVAIGLGLFAMLGWLFMVALWPYALKSPIYGPIEAILFSYRFPVRIQLLFDGQRITSESLPRTYLIQSLLITTPIPILLLALTGLIKTGVCLRKPANTEQIPLALASVWIVLPLTLFTVMRPNVYDGMRHFLFLLPGIAILAGAGAAWIVAFLPSVALQHVAAGAVVFSLVLPIPLMRRLHPYEYVYYNKLTGGLGGAVGRYETDYWILSYREAAEWINKQKNTDAFDGKPLNVLVAADEGCMACFSSFINDPATSTGLTSGRKQPGAIPRPYNYYVSMTRYDLDKNFPDSPVVHTIGREGAIFCVIKERKPSS